MHFLFDFDGTIADSFSLTNAIHQSLQTKYHLPSLSEAEFKAFKDLSAQEIFKKSGISMLQLPFFLADVRAETAKRIQTVPTFSGLTETLQQLKAAGHQLAIVTSNSVENVELFLYHHQLQNLFAFVHSELNLWGKAAALKHVLKTKKISPAETYYVGDEIRDITAAKTAGLKIIAVGWGLNSQTALAAQNPDFLITQPNQLLKFL